MKNKVKQILSLNDEILNELKTKSFTLITNDEYDEGDDKIYEGATTYIINKSGFHVTYVILSIENDIVHCGGLYEDYGEIQDLKLTDLTIDTLCDICLNIV